MSDKPDIAAEVMRRVFEGVVIETPDGPMVLREVRSEPDVVIFVDIFIEPGEPVTGTFVFSENLENDDGSNKS